MLLAHLSDLHLRDEADAVEFERQLDRVVAKQAFHLLITGDLLDRWNRPLLARALDALAARGLLDPQRLTLIHGNHDLSSSGGHPRRRTDLWRLALRFWDPPPLLAWRRRRFYQEVTARAPGVAISPPFLKPLAGLRFAAVNTVPAPWRPFSFAGGEVALQHARGAIAEAETTWLASLPRGEPLIVLMHHYPGEAGTFRWRNKRAAGDVSRWSDRWRVAVPMEIAAGDRARFWAAASRAGVIAILCGHVHRARLEHHDGIAVGLNGQSGAEWAGRTVAFYQFTDGGVTAEYDNAGARPG